MTSVLFSIFLLEGLHTYISLTLSFFLPNLIHSATPMFGSFTPAMATPYVEGSPSSGYMSPYYNTASGSGSAASPGIYQSMSPSYVSMSPSRSMAGGDGQGFRMGSPQFNPRRSVHYYCYCY